jgi:hypothetical protein
MPMYELLMIACLIAQPVRCEEVHLPFQQPMGMSQCMQEAQFHMVHWLEGRPGWAIRRWRCGLPET